VDLTFITALSTIALFVGILICSEVGRRVGRARLARGNGLSKGIDSAEGAVFGLLGLLIAFSFFGAASRFEGRRHLIAEEANAIGTAYLRLDLLPADVQTEMRDLLRRYLDARVATYADVADASATESRLAAGVALQEEIWAKATAASQRPGAAAQAPMLLLPALNEMIDITTTREMATLNHPPAVVFILLVALSLVGAVLVGYATSPNPERNWFHTAIFAAILALTVYVIIDLEFPRRGLIRVDDADQILINLRKGMS